jgi:hypothetical protein
VSKKILKRHPFAWDCCRAAYLSLALAPRTYPQKDGVVLFFFFRYNELADFPALFLDFSQCAPQKDGVLLFFV